MSDFDRLILQCRSGFEKEAAAEITDRAAEAGHYGYCQLAEGEGYVQFIIPQPGAAEAVLEQLDFFSLIFIRQWMVARPPVTLEGRDRIAELGPLIEGIGGCSEVWVEHPDTTEGREMNRFCRKFSSALAQHLRKAGVLGSKSGGNRKRLMLFALSGSEMFVGYAATSNSAPWEMGIPRLKFPKAAPSRSTLKLEEAWHWFLPARVWDERLRMGGTAVDLGAAPGGWTWQLVKRSLFVTAVDNGPMNTDLMESGQVTHVREDAYQFEPEKPVDWMVCDVVDKPVKTASMAVTWLAQGWCREMIFNLKLPMKKRYAETVSCLGLIADQLEQLEIPYQMRVKQLYHNREEVTVHLYRTGVL
ncbi:23S rRNA (cytidine(2498)-2'-O)-methyltransferase RlmM [Marinobacterium jannaschii]|uniref:23S rRNA (cytidine(2498)-2'-O)-methyltransferase RlmM n=1 Tax=Marinobacterium jannaschii TaxID=64970 RepID=UPI0004816A90|nr:23S rRNA (cytidine(2498)-2'-O)-methyltransferase RlmM [Marinobacterium jannaschii]